jgi:hypothetical protein
LLLLLLLLLLLWRAECDVGGAIGCAVQMEPGGVFKVSDVQGEVLGLLDKNVGFTFAPESAGNYYRRAFCLVRDTEPVFVDLIGTGACQFLVVLTSGHVFASSSAR